jgi:hypothetical protein
VCSFDREDTELTNLMTQSLSSNESSNWNRFLMFQETDGRLGQVKQELELTREREANYARERAELSTQLAEAQKAKASLECELESHYR